MLYKGLSRTSLCLTDFAPYPINCPGTVVMLHKSNGKLRCICCLNLGAICCLAVQPVSGCQTALVMCYT